MTDRILKFNNTLRSRNLFAFTLLFVAAAGCGGSNGPTLNQRSQAAFLTGVVQ
jgi:hypothetical protein